MQPPLAVVPGDLYRTAAALADESPDEAVPDAAVDPGWAATAALTMVTAAIGDRLAMLADAGTALADALCVAARAYETADSLWVAAGHELDAGPR